MNVLPSDDERRARSAPAIVSTRQRRSSGSRTDSRASSGVIEVSWSMVHGNACSAGMKDAIASTTEITQIRHVKMQKSFNLQWRPHLGDCRLTIIDDLLGDANGLSAHQSQSSARYPT